MLISYIYNPVVLVDLMLAIIGVYYNDLSAVDIEAEYTRSEFVTDNFYMKKSDVTMNYKEAESYCIGLRMELFEPTSDMPLMNVFTHFQTKAIWTNLYTHKTAEILVNANTELPVTNTKDMVISLPTNPVPATHMVALRLNADNTTMFDAALITDKLAAVCIEHILYPNRTHDRLVLTNVKSKTLYQISEMKRRAQKIKRRIRNKMLAIPKLGKLEDLRTKMKKQLNVTLDVTNAWDRQHDLVQRLEGDLRVLISPIRKQWKNIVGKDDLALILSMRTEFSDIFYNSIQEIQEPLFYPESMIEPEDRDKVDFMFAENRQPLLAITVDTDRTYFFLHFRENGTEDFVTMASYNRPLLPFYDTQWDNFYRFSIWDIIFFCLFGVNGFCVLFVCIIEFANSKMDKRRYKRWQGEFAFKNDSDSERGRPFVTRKITKSPVHIRENVKETRPIKRPRSKSLDQQSVKFRSFKKKRAPRPPTEMYELVGGAT